MKTVITNVKLKKNLSDKENNIIKAKKKERQRWI